MSMALVNAIRKLGWPDRHGEIQYGNAAILCYLSDTQSIMRMKIKDIDPALIKQGQDFIATKFEKVA